MKKAVTNGSTTPTLKRGPSELSSPSSPELNEPKKSKNGDLSTPSNKSKWILQNMYLYLVISIEEYIPLYMKIAILRKYVEYLPVIFVDF